MRGTLARIGRAAIGPMGWLVPLFIFPVPAKTGGASEAPISFRNDVMAVLSKAGCNSGQCHGNANGKAGFKLSLRGQDPDWDYNVLTRDMFARRTNPEEASQSLILLKPTTQIAHEGGQRFRLDSPEYDLLRQWIARGMSSDPPDEPSLARLA